MYTIILTRYGGETDDKIIKAIQTPAKNQEELVQAILEIARTNDSVFQTVQSTDLAYYFLDKHGLCEFPDNSPMSELFNEFCAYLKTKLPEIFISQVAKSNAGNPIFVIEDGYVGPELKEFIREACNDYISRVFCDNAIPYNISRLLWL